LPFLWTWRGRVQGDQAVTELEKQTKKQRHSNAMLRMRRMMKEIALILRLQDINSELSEEEVNRICFIAGWDDLRVERALKRLMEKINV
jgi:hypothetical protein